MYLHKYTVQIWIQYIVHYLTHFRWLNVESNCSEEWGRASIFLLVFASVRLESRRLILNEILLELELEYRVSNKKISARLKKEKYEVLKILEVIEIQLEQ